MAKVNRPLSFIWPLVVLIIAFGAFYFKPWQTKPEQTISVTTQGKAQVVPNIAKITASIESRNSNLDQARTQNAQKVENIVQKLKDLGVDQKDIKTESISGSRGYEPRTLIYPPVYPKNDVFSQVLEITIRNFEITNEVISALTQNGATDLRGPNLMADDQKLSEAKSAARQNAVDNARQKAQELATYANRKLGKVISVQEENEFEPPTPIVLESETQLKQKSAQIQPGQSEVTVNIKASFALK